MGHGMGRGGQGVTGSGVRYLLRVRVPSLYWLGAPSSWAHSIIHNNHSCGSRLRHWSAPDASQIRCRVPVTTMIELWITPPISCPRVDWRIPIDPGPPD